MAIRGLHPGLEQTAGIGLKMFSNDELDKIHLATLDVLWNVGVNVESQEAIQSGEYITHEHTYANMKQQSQVDLFDRNTRDVWEERGSKDIVEKSYEKAFDILSDHKPEPLSGKVQISLDEIFKDAETRAEKQAN